MSASATSTADGTSAVIDGMMTVRRRLAQSRHGELTVEEAADLMQMKHAACGLRELSKPEERSLARHGGGLRMDGIRALDLWDLVIEMLHSSFKRTSAGKPVARQRAIKKTHQHQNEETPQPR